MTKYETLRSMMSYDTILKTKCPCGHEGRFSQRDAITLFGADATPFDVRRRLRCSKCHQVGKAEVWI
ncbi:hypothetical protein [Phenylobacterium sp.]|uniref:hypothetical protein n=1 Tax=Phenylobacterium sp. TaxID=1871053 RepID=UPI00272F245C|nr:hypothetical protein [Phenylobacterium sp.]MDP1599045.1 hypothetical protein [Phenylobacterium sp.]MDP3590473.1 hypothetical protein [Phenylobacterium sp.]